MMKGNYSLIGVLALTGYLLSGAAMSFGQNVQPRLLSGGTIGRLPSPDDFADITAGDTHTCAIKNNGNVYCWGGNSNGQVGIPSNVNCSGYGTCINRPTFVLTAAQIEAGAEHTCALSSTGIASCWGLSAFGEVGGGATANGQIIGVYGNVFSPTLVGGNHIFSSISAGKYSTCGNASDGVWCWGAIVDPTNGAPNPFRIFSFTGWSKIAVGFVHACGLFSSGIPEVDCWGNNASGQLGIDPAQFPTTEQAGDAFFSIRSSLSGSPSRVSTQMDFTCADQSATGIVQCVGNNSLGQLGNGTTSTSPVFQAQTVGNGMHLHGVSAGSDHACALDMNSDAFCWGNNHWGQLGNGTESTSNSPQPVTMPTGVTFKKLAAGNYHTCAIGSDNHIYCWGFNGLGDVGVGHTPTGSIDASYLFFPSPARALDPQ